MFEISASELRGKTGSAIERAMRAPVRITRNRRPVAALLSNEEYERLLEIEDAYWGEMARMAMSAESVQDDAVNGLLAKLGD
jgi:prevent-host-death family protein